MLNEWHRNKIGVVQWEVIFSSLSKNKEIPSAQKLLEPLQPWPQHSEAADTGKDNTGEGKDSKLRADRWLPPWYGFSWSGKDNSWAFTECMVDKQNLWQKSIDKDAILRGEKYAYKSYDWVVVVLELRRDVPWGQLGESLLRHTDLFPQIISGGHGSVKRTLRISDGPRTNCMNLLFCCIMCGKLACQVTQC